MSGIHAQCYSRFIYPASLPVAGSKGAPVRTLPTLSKSIASFCRNFLPCAPPRHSLLPNHGFLIATRQKLVIQLTRSQQTRKHFLIATFSAISEFASYFAHHRLRIAPLVFDTLVRFREVLTDTLAWPLTHLAAFRVSPIPSRHGRIAAL